MAQKLAQVVQCYTAQKLAKKKSDRTIHWSSFTSRKRNEGISGYLRKYRCLEVAECVTSIFSRFLFPPALHFFFSLVDLLSLAVVYAFLHAPSEDRKLAFSPVLRKKNTNWAPLAKHL
jgi:hypothetical protein